MFEYTPSQFTCKDYKNLRDYATQCRELRSLLRAAQYRDKRIQRALYRELSTIFIDPLEKMPLHINSKSTWRRTIAQWRLSIGR